MESNYVLNGFVSVCVATLHDQYVYCFTGKVFLLPEFPIDMDLSDTIIASNDESIPAEDEFMDIYSGLEGDCVESDSDKEQEGML